MPMSSSLDFVIEDGEVVPVLSIDMSDATAAERDDVMNRALAIDPNDVELTSTVTPDDGTPPYRVNRTGTGRVSLEYDDAGPDSLDTLRAVTEHYVSTFLRPTSTEK